jgi:DNA-binding transcriptional MerR regulator
LPSEKMLIHELAEQAGVTVRTVRYYTQLGLLPEPDTQGKFAYYSQEHLDRLELIRRLKNLRLPLQEIEQIVKATNAEDLHKLLTYQDQLGSMTTNWQGKTHPPEPSQSEALEYIAKLRHQSRIRDQILFEKKDAFRSVIPPSKTSQPDLMIAKPDRPQEGQSWRRVELGEGVELQYREPVDFERQQRISKLISFARRLFRSKD